jgi:mutator protein MutT
MKIEEFKQQLKLPLRQTTLCLLIKEDQILLAMKKRGFGEGKWNGVGGKPDLGETIEQAAIRETQEEIGVTSTNMEKVASLDFFFLEESIEKDWNQQVVVFLVTEWNGEPTESEEMKPTWFDKDKIPFKDMWPDDAIWLPKVLDGKKVKAEFLFDKAQNIIEHELEVN